MFYFSESFVGGWFGFGRTYGGVARFQLQSTSELDAEWPAALQQVAEWRDRRKERATTLTIQLNVLPAALWQTVDRIKNLMMVPQEALPVELRGLLLDISAFTEPDAEPCLDLVLYPV